MRGVAHISFAGGGGVFLPAGNPYEREMLVEHISDTVRSKGRLRVAVDDHSWSVWRGDGVPSALCFGCGYALHSACYSATNGAAYCLKCAFGTQPDAHHVDRQVMR